MDRPAPGEFAPYYATYTDRVPDGDVLDILRGAPDALAAALAPVSPGQETFAYAPGKWSVREVVGHIVDTERLFAFRALHFARGDGAPLPGMEQDAWAAHSNAADRPLADLLAEFRALREANARWIASLDGVACARSGTASGVTFTVRAIVYILAGHEIHHRDLLRERYVAALGGPRRADGSAS